MIRITPIRMLVTSNSLSLSKIRQCCATFLRVASNLRCEEHPIRNQQARPDSPSYFLLFQLTTALVRMVLLVLMIEFEPVSMIGPASVQTVLMMQMSASGSVRWACYVLMKCPLDCWCCWLRRTVSRAPSCSLIEALGDVDCDAAHC